MDQDITIRHEPGRDLAVARFEASIDQIGEHLGRAFAAVGAYLARSGVAPTGGAVAHYEMAPGGFKVAAGFTVAQPVKGDDSVAPLRLPETDVLTTTHVGPYEELPQTYAALHARAAELGRSLDDTTMWEEYLTGPDTPREQMRTVVSWPLRGAD